MREHGPAFCYTNQKRNIVAKTANMKQAQKLSDKDEVEIVDGHRVLGSVRVSESACCIFRKNRSIQSGRKEVSLVKQ